MEERFRRLGYRYGYCQNILNQFKQKTTLKVPQIYLVLDFFIFFLRKITIEKGQTNILLFGRFYIKQGKRKKYAPRFYATRNLKLNMNNLRDFPERGYLGIQSATMDYKEMFKCAKKYLHLKFKESLFLFNLLIDGIIKELKEKDVVKLRNIGIFYTKLTDMSESNLFGREGNYKQTKMIKFIALGNFTRETREEVEEYKMTKKLKKILDFYNFSTRINHD